MCTCARVHACVCAHMCAPESTPASHLCCVLLQEHSLSGPHVGICRRALAQGARAGEQPNTQAPSMCLFRQARQASWCLTCPVARPAHPGRVKGPKFGVSALLTVGNSGVVQLGRSYNILPSPDRTKNGRKHTLQRPPGLPDRGATLWSSVVSPSLAGVRQRRRACGARAGRRTIARRARQERDLASLSHASLSWSSYTHTHSLSLTHTHIEREGGWREGELYHIR